MRGIFFIFAKKHDIIYPVECFTPLCGIPQGKINQAKT